MIYGIIFILGLVLGSGVFLLLSYVFTGVDGTLIIDDSDPITTRWTLEMKTDPYEIAKKKRVKMNVKIKGD